MKLESFTVGVVCHIKWDFGITLWQAIKLRIAGKNYKPIADEISRALKTRLEQGETNAIIH